METGVKYTMIVLFAQATIQYITSKVHKRYLVVILGGVLFIYNWKAIYKGIDLNLYVNRL